MANESETLADIVAEIRAYGAQPPPRLMWLEIADRIEAALKRERAAFDCECAGIAELAAKEEAARHTPGNAAAIYAALVKIHDMTNALDEKCGVDPVEIRDLARAALSAPPRNCDVGMLDEQTARYYDFCYQHQTIENRCAGCPAKTYSRCELKWAQMPYTAEEGGEE